MFGRVFLIVGVVLACLTTGYEALAYDDYSIVRCKIIEVLKRGQRESNRFIIRAYNRRGNVLETQRAHSCHFFDGRAEPELGLFLLVEEGTCPP